MHESFKKLRRDAAFQKDQITGKQIGLTCPRTTEKKRSVLYKHTNKKEPIRSSSGTCFQGERLILPLEIIVVMRLM